MDSADPPDSQSFRIPASSDNTVPNLTPCPPSSLLHPAHLQRALQRRRVLVQHGGKRGVVVPAQRRPGAAAEQAVQAGALLWSRHSKAVGARQL